MNRRRFFSLLSGILISPWINVSVAATNRTHPFQSEELNRLRRSLFIELDKGSLRKVYNISTRKITSTMDDFRSSSGIIAGSVRKDFLNNRVCTVDGWVLSETEVILCIMI